MFTSEKSPWGGSAWYPTAWFRDHLRVSVESFYFVSARLGTSVLVWLVVGIALALPAGLWILQENMLRASAGWEGRPGLSLYFSEGAEEAEIAQAAQRLRDSVGIDGVTVISADDALDDFKAHTGLGDALALLGENPLPASMTARFAENISAVAVEALVEKARVLPGVAEVVFEKTWLERLRDLSTVVSRLGAVWAGLFGVGAVLVTASSVRLAIESRLDELRVLKMVGATQGQIRRPFLYFGALYGFGGGVIAAMLIAITLVVIEPPLQSLLGSYQAQLDLAGFGLGFLGVLLMVASLLGVAGSMLAVRQRLKNLELF